MKELKSGLENKNNNPGLTECVLPDLVFRVNICLHSDAALQLSLTYVTGTVHKLRQTLSITGLRCVVLNAYPYWLEALTHLELRVTLSVVSRKCSCVRVTSSPLRVTVMSGKPFCDVHELIISDTFW